MRTARPWPGSGFSDGINGGVNVPLGYRVACTFVNQTASLTLLKNVVNDNGGSATASAWDLTGDAGAADGPHRHDGRRVRDRRPGEHLPGAPRPRLHAHRVGRPGLPVLEAAAVRGRRLGGCRGQPRSAAATRSRTAAATGRSRSPALDSPVYRFVNDDVAPILTLVKTVTNDNGGTALPHGVDAHRDRRRAARTSPARPAAPRVTAQPVRAGVAYTIGETGPAAYDWASLSCTGLPEHHAGGADTHAAAG